jgi:hypothetical protein
MNFNPLVGSGVVNALLMDVALRVQLAPSQYRLAMQHYETLGHYLEREGSPLKGLVSRLYAQGSMAIGAVISSKFENDEFDLDVILELVVDAYTPPAVVLDTVFHTIKGDPGSRYYKVTRRNTRCVTVDYDNMHVDFTPAVRLRDPRERVSNIFHAHEDDPIHRHRHVMANPWGFANWFEARMPAARFFAETVLRKSAEPLPPLEQLNEKSLPLLALQLIKRWRNKVYDQRDGMRMPPSVVLSCLVGMNASVRLGLLEELTSQVNYIKAHLEAADRRGEKFYLMNPRCPDGDCFTDRWPESLEHQR